MYTERAVKYFEDFSAKDISSLENLFDKNVSLRDWEVNVNGLADVLTANQKIFTSVKSIAVKPINLYEVDHTVIAELIINIDNKDFINVVDIIDFSKSGLITSIRAYKC
jgi:hypothetical protein